MPSPSLFALVDCNNFYASCERVFNPALRNKPIVVLSNNDGCIVARSEEAKALGVPMGKPFFESRELIESNGVHVFSSNYVLYGDMSQRVFTAVARFAPEMEIYSIDEAFLNLAGFERTDLTAYGQEMRATIKKWTGIPISIGIAETKTLAKIANRLAKRSRETPGVVDLTLPGCRENALTTIQVGNIWGIGSRLSKRLIAKGVTTAAELRDVDDHWIRKQMGIVGVRIVHELRGISCLPLEMCPSPKKGITCSRSFGRPVTTLEEMKEAVTAYVSRAAVKLRKEGSSARCLTVFLVIKHFKDQHPRPNKEVTIELPIATDNTRELIRYAATGVEKIFRPGPRYHKAGVILTDLTPTAQAQCDVFDDCDRVRSRQLMATIDLVNRRMGATTLQFAAQGQARPWHMRCEMRSPNYTANWEELAKVRA